ncbi:MAG TPA: UDP-N-acetylglucosamine 2-epimerase (non-hydrolyzing) [Gemmatimonadaceae bacterium]|nr:UDP-N-acetylglucosamine 2-epimerase (non-hydrolyzing) [Gemmatimonadaceae bacterium]
MPTELLHVVGARPNFPKLAPVHRAARARGISQLVVHTGQHYDDAMSGGFFRQLDIPAPDVNLEVGSGSHAAQTSRIIERFEAVLAEARPRWVVVYGDVNSTMAAAIVASKLGIRVAHVEAGLRSFDRTMPEEINRIVTDRLADLLLTPSPDAGEQLRAEGEPAEEIVFVGNVMIDSLCHALAHPDSKGFAEQHGATGNHVVVTLHRPSNVDDPARLALLATALREVAAERPVFFPIHPRTRQRLQTMQLDLGAVRLFDPIGYFEMIDLERSAYAVITDSGGMQEETTALRIPCFTVRDNTERPVTVTHGTNQIVRDIASLPALVRTAAPPNPPRMPEGWDGHAGERIVDALISR